ncbi:hypothetical protein Hanom_Chr17g01578011 [Helianthus anomalus]
MKFFYIREEVIPIDMEFSDSAPIPKEDMKIRRGAAWYEKLMALPNRVFEVVLYQSAFPAFVGIMGTRPLRDDDEYWLEQIQPNFMYARAELFAVPPAATEGVRIPNPMPCRAITPAGKEIVYLSSEESVASSEHELKPTHSMFAGVLHNLGVEHEEKKPKRVATKKVTVAGGAANKKAETAGAASDTASRKGIARFRKINLEEFIYVADSFEELYAIGGKPQSSAVAAARSLGSAGP